MDFLQILGLLAIAIGVIMLLLWMISAIYSRQRKRAVTSDQISSQKALQICLEDITYKRNVISNLYFPVRSESSLTTVKYRRTEQIIVGAGGVLLLATCKESGKIDNRDPDIWISIRDDERFEFPSPLAALHSAGAAISAILKRNGFREPCVYEAVVFTDNQSDPVDYDDGVVFMSELERLIKDLNDTKTYDSVEQFFMIRAIKKEGLTKKQLEKRKTETNK
ncbi:MAG: NERD domain-containing protein [Clostridia bacterium]|nr:NERD domain-containing protein [Clostridia bacterium]